MPGLSAIELDDMRLAEPFIFDASEIEDRKDLVTFVQKGEKRVPRLLPLTFALISRWMRTLSSARDCEVTF
jgi:hypothetical protein